MDKDCAKRPDDRSISLDVYWQNQTKPSIVPIAIKK